MQQVARKSGVGEARAPNEHGRRARHAPRCRDRRSLQKIGPWRSTPPFRRMDRPQPRSPCYCFSRPCCTAKAHAVFTSSPAIVPSYVAYMAVLDTGARRLDLQSTFMFSGGGPPCVVIKIDLYSRKLPSSTSES